jgi:hypothetical protein
MHGRLDGAQFDDSRRVRIGSPGLVRREKGPVLSDPTFARTSFTNPFRQRASYLLAYCEDVLKVMRMIGDVMWYFKQSRN